jgi:hypothetical protein
LTMMPNKVGTSHSDSKASCLTLSLTNSIFACTTKSNKLDILALLIYLV